MFNFMNRLQTQIFAFFVILLLAVQSISFWMSFNSNKQLEQQQLSNQLAVAEVVFQAEYENRNYYLSAFAETAAKDFGLKDIFIDGDNRSFLVALNNHRKRINANLAIAVSAEGKIIGELVANRSQGREKVALGSEQGHAFRYSLATEFENINPLYLLDGKLYQIKFSPLTSGGSSVIGWVGFGYVIDDKLAGSLAQLTGLSSGFYLNAATAQDEQKSAVPNTNPEASVQGQFIGHSEPAFSHELQAIVVNYLIQDLRHDDYIFWRQSLGTVDGQHVFAYMFQSVSDVLQTLEQQWLKQIGLLLLLLPVSLLLAFIISSKITRPIKQLIEQAKFIAKGNYDSSVDVGSSLELKQLGQEFTLMQQSIVSREKKIAHQAFHDPLTSLANGNELNRVSSAWLQQGTSMGLCLINIRRLTEVNLTLGHAVGDEVIKEFAQRLAFFSDRALVCRISGDEFVLAFESLATEQVASLMAELQQQVDHKYCYHDIMLHLQFTAGVSIFQQGIDLVTLLRQADTAVQHAKSNKLDYQIYTPEIDSNTLDRFQLINELKHAIDSDELVLFYQPKMCLKSQQITHVEALVRWQHPKKGMIPPDVFIPIAEKTGQMHGLTHWVLNEAIAQYHKWQALGINLGIAVNISAENLKEDNFCEWIITLLLQTQMPVSALTLEITEDAVVADPDHAIAQLKALKMHGLKLSIDDYGTGYSSLTQLKQLPVDELKIDKSFVQQLMTDNDDQIIVNSTLQLAHNLGLSVVAEGIEDKATLTWLTEKGCEMGQGFYLSRPLSAAAFNEWLAKQSV
ncbi:EAL domain-containing protein [Shewanella sp.]|uniref:EAL domain-containing protein n=1 Tax=Shewanella sp. TaxID=50422 RepID=UPI00405462BD